jgi:hypothetical protein
MILFNIHNLLFWRIADCFLYFIVKISILRNIQSVDIWRKLIMLLHAMCNRWSFGDWALIFHFLFLSGHEHRVAIVWILLATEVIIASWTLHYSFMAFKIVSSILRNSNLSISNSIHNFHSFFGWIMLCFVYYSIIIYNRHWTSNFKLLIRKPIFSENLFLTLFLTLVAEWTLLWLWAINLGFHFSSSIFILIALLIA